MPKHLLELTQMQLDRVALAALKKGTGTERQCKKHGAIGRSLGASPLFQRSGSIRAVKLSVLIAAPLQAWQPELFEPSHRESRRHVAQLVDRLSNRLGREAVVRAVPQPDAQPEFAFRYEPLAGVLPSQSTASEGVRHIFRRKPSDCKSCRQEPKNEPDPGRERRWKFLPRPLRLESEPIRVGCVVRGARGAADSVSSARLPSSGPRLGPGTNSNRLVARPLRAAGLLPDRNGHGNSLLALPPPVRRQMVFAWSV